MAKTYRLSAGPRFVNAMFSAMTALGIGKSYRHILTVTGRTSGRPYSTPVDVMQHDGSPWLVAGYGVVSWVRNVRTSGHATLRRGRDRRAYAVEEVGPPDAVPVLRMYLQQVPVTAAYFDVTADATDEAIAADVARHPVFRLRPTDP